MQRDGASSTTLTIPHQIVCLLGSSAVWFVVGTLFRLSLPLFGRLAPMTTMGTLDGSSHPQLPSAVCGIVLAVVYLRLVHLGKCNPTLRSGIAFAFPAFALNGVYASIYAESLVALFTWTLQGALSYAAAGAALGWSARLGRDNWQVRVVSQLRAPSDVVWERLKRRDTFLFITRRFASYEGSEDWPEILMTLGQSIKTRVRLFRILPGSPYGFRITRVDEPQMEIDTVESGEMIHTWNHSMLVKPLSSDRCVYPDHVELNAGVLTPLVWTFASLFYRYRHWRWHKLLRQVMQTCPTKNSPQTVDASRQQAANTDTTGTTHLDPNVRLRRLHLQFQAAT